MRHRPSKRRSYTRDDHISNLPEALLSDILSRLPTEDAVRTSVLSKAWQNRWTSSCNNVCIDELHWYRPEKRMSFTNAMNKILHPSNHLQSFRLTSHELNDETTFQTLIKDVIHGHNELQRFEIRTAVQCIAYPSCLLNSTSLRKLRLDHLGATVCVDSKNFAPNLTTIYLYNLTIVNKGLHNLVKFDFPVLENFTLFHVKWMSVKSVEICAPSLTTFTTGLMDSFEWDDGFTITVVSPRLASFVCYGGVQNIFIANGSSVVSAVLDYEDAKYFSTLQRRETIKLRVNKLVNSFTSLAELELSPFAAKALLLGPAFHLNVTTLWLHDLASPEKLLALLHAMPSLKFLVVDVKKMKTYDYKAMESVPSCVVSRLEKVVMRFFKGKVRQYRLARFFSRNANQLKKLTLVTDDMISRKLLSTIRKRLSTFTRGSDMLEIDARADVGKIKFGSYPTYM